MKQQLISTAVFTKLVLFLLLASPAACQKTLHSSTATVSCKPERALVLGSGNDGQVKKYEHWDAGCRIVVGGQTIFYRDFFLRKPTVTYHEAEVLGSQVMNDLLSTARKFPAAAIDCAGLKTCRVAGRPEMIHAVYAEANRLYFSQEHNDKNADSISVPQENQIRKQLISDYAAFNDVWFGGELPADTSVSYFPVKNSTEIGEEEEQLIPVGKPKFAIFVNAYYDRDAREADFTLMHEMAHVWVALHGGAFESHGEKWQNEMRQLADEGAFNNLW